MNQAPNMISTKDLAYLEDIFQWNFNASKKANSDLDKIQLQSVKEMITKVRSMHTKHCKEILAILGGNNE